jgi:hypothetical protein
MACWKYVPLHAANVSQVCYKAVLVFQSHACLVLDRTPSSVTLKASPIGFASVCTELFLVLEGQNEGS